MMYPSNIKKSTNSTSSTSTSSTCSTYTRSRSAIPLFMMNNKTAAAQVQVQAQQRISSSRISTEKIFCFILLVSISCFQLALHYSSIDIRRLHRGDGDSSKNIHHDDEKKMMESSMATTKTTTTTTTPTRPGAAAAAAAAVFNHHHRVANNNVCLNIKSKQTAPASMQPKIPINDQGQRFIASGGYEAIAKGSGPIHAAGPIINLISNIQHVELHIFGTVAELGVHHGRFTSFLFITARTTEKLVVVDLFEELQDQNFDMSGLGDFKQFVQGMSKYGLHASDLYKIYKGSTDQIPFDWAEKDGFEPFRLVSIDAGHTAALTFNDLQLAFCNLLKGGVVIVDDWFHPRWPGVVEGFYEFTHHHHHQNNNNNDSIQIDVYPFLLCESKLYMTNDKSVHKLYMERILQDPSTLSEWASPLAHESSRVENKTWWYEMNGGISYLRCDSSRLPSSSKSDTLNIAQQIWLDRLY